MATPPNESSTHRRGGGTGGGGKIRKHTYRNTQATPYERPLTALRNSNSSVWNTNGWLSRLVDPASKLITSSARKILSSVFSKRILPSTAPKPPASDGPLQSTNKHQGASSMVHPMAEQNVEDVACGHPTFDIDDVAELEQMLKQKRFTRYEIDRLTTLLRSRTVNGSIEGEEGNPSIKIASEQVMKHHAYTPRQDSIIPFYRCNGSTSTPTTRKKDITSPSELAKAYMNSRASKFSSPMSDSRGLALNSWMPNNPTMFKSFMESRHLESGGNQAKPSNSVHWSKMQQSASLKGSDLRKFAYCEPSSSAYDISASQRRVSGFKNASLKRRSSVLHDQYGSTGPIRRVRQKLNLLNSKGKDALVREGSPLISGSTENTIALADTPTSSVDPAPTHSNEMAQQTAPLLDQSTCPQNKPISDKILGSSVAKYPPTSASEILASHFFRNLEKGESSGVKDTQLDNMMYDSGDTSFGDAGYYAIKDGITSKNEQTKLNSFSTEKISDAKLLNTQLAEATFCDEKNSGVGPLHKKQAFHMSVVEDFIDMDEDDAEGALSHSISATATPTEERHPLISSGQVTLPVVSTDANEVPSGSFRMGGVMGLENSDEPVISEKSISFRDSVGTSSLSSQLAIPNGVSKLSTEASLEGKDDALFASGSRLKSPQRASSLLLDSSPIVAVASSGPKPDAPDSNLEASRFGSGPADADRTSKQSEGDRINVSPEAKRLFSEPQADPVAAASVLVTSSIFSFGDAANNNGSLSNGSSGSSLHSKVLHSNFTSDTKQNNMPSTNATIFGSSNGLGSRPTGSSSASDHGGELFNAKVSTDGSVALSTPSSAPMTGSSGTLNNTVGTSTEVHFSSSSSASTSSVFSSMAHTVKSSDGASPSAPVFNSFVASSTSASSKDTTTNFLFGASSTTASGTGFTFGATTTPVQTNAAATNTGLVTGVSTTPITFGVASTSSLTTSATTNTGFVSGGVSTPASVTSSSGVSFGTSSAATNTTSTAGFSFGALSTLPVTSSGLPSGASSTPASTSSVFSFGASSTPAVSGFSSGGSSTPATASSGFSVGGSSTPATASSVIPFGGSSAMATSSSVFPFGASSTPVTTSSAFSFGASSRPATTSSVFPFGGSSNSATTSSGFSLGGSSTPPANTIGAGIPSTMTSSPAAKTTFSGFSFGAPSTTGTTIGAGIPSSAPTGATSSVFLFGASSTSTPVTSTAGSSSTFGSLSTPNPFSFGAASTPATSTANNGSPFGFMAGSSTFPFNAGTTNNTSAAHPFFGNTNPFGSTAAVNNNNQTSMEDSMAEDNVQAPSPAFPAFGAQQTANTSGFGFGAPNPSGTSNSFQFASQPNLSNPSPFQSSGSLGRFNAGGSFSLGSGGGDKSNRRIIKPKKGVRRK